MQKKQLKTVSTSPDLCVFIGRFEPLHQGHVRVIREGLARAKFMVVLIGSANEPRTYRNPFYASEREQVIRETFNHDPRLIVLPLEDSDYNLNDWLERTHLTVDAAWGHIKTQYPDAPKVPSISLIGHAKDATSFYLNLFPRWGSIDVPQEHIMCATKLRHELFGDYEMIFDDLLAHEGKRRSRQDYMKRYAEVAHSRATAFLEKQKILLSAVGGGEPPDITQPVHDFLVGFINSNDYFVVCAEYAFVASNKFIWRHAPYASIGQAADAVVVQSGHILMIKRNSYPGMGLWALPGGYVEEFEEVLDSALRELREEVELKVPDKVLLGHLKDSKRFSAPHRSSRGRMMTEAFLFHLDPGPLPKTKKGGQAGDEETQDIDWIPLSKLRRDKCFEDHYAVIKNMTAPI